MTVRPILLLLCALGAQACLSAEQASVPAPISEPISKERVDAFWSRVEGGESAQVLAELEAMEREGPLSARLWTVRGFALGEQLRPEDAEAAFMRAEQLDPTLALAVVERCILAYNTYRLEVAVGHCTRALTVGPRPEYHAHLTRGLSFLKLNRLDDAYADFQACKQLEPENAEAYYDESWVWAARGDLTRVIEQIRLAGERNPYYAQRITVGNDDPYRRFHQEAEWQTFIASLPFETVARPISPLLLQQGPRNGSPDDPG